MVVTSAFVMAANLVMTSSPSPSSSFSSSLFATKGTPVPRIGLGLAALGRPGYINLG